MSEHRSPWDHAEESLLRRIHSEMPGALLREISLAFGKRNHQKRTKWAVKAKIKDLGLSVERGKQIYAFVSAMLSQKVHDEVTTSALFEEQFSIPSVQPFRIQYNQNVPEKIFIPLHPLIAEARQHAAYVQTAGYASSVSSNTRWPSILEEEEISRLRCAEADREALRNYMNYLQR